MMSRSPAISSLGSGASPYAVGTSVKAPNTPPSAPGCQTFLSGDRAEPRAAGSIRPVARPRSEVLVELEPGAALDAAVGSGAEVLQRLPPRLAIVAADAEGVQALERHPEVRSVFRGDVPPDALARLDEPGRLFAAAWNGRRVPKERRGDGLSWDAPGFDAP
jgi:hypothetical protein